MTTPRTQYLEFVGSRAKRMGSLGADLMHAAVGMMGEAVELRFSLSAENTRVELGDFYFYAGHYKLAWEWHGQEMPVAIPPREAPRLAMCYDGLIDACGGLLDLTKKIWVYNKTPDTEMQNKIGIFLGDIEANYRGLLALVGYTELEAMADNEAKLRERYPTGYSDAAAQARADDKNWGQA